MGKRVMYIYVCVRVHIFVRVRFAGESTALK